MSDFKTSGLSLATVVRFHRDAAMQRVAGEWMAATADGRLHTFTGPSGAASEVGARILELIDGKRSIAELVAGVVEAFEVSRDVGERDTLQFIGVLVEKQVLETLP
jgi:pyrroloquinoline quinone biosynthesis protein D